MEKCQQNLD